MSEAHPGALSGLKVLDFTTLLPGPYATMILADLGADVLRIEHPARPDLTRGMPPQVGNSSAVHGTLNRNKRSLALDLKLPQAREAVYELVEQYDIVVEQFRPGVMDRLGVGFESLRSINSALIYCAITGYGQTGPYRDRAGHDLNYLALSGILHASGRTASGPAPFPIQVADVAGGSHHAVMSILAAVIHRMQSGEGQFLDISMTDAAFALQALDGNSELSGGPALQPESGMLNGGTFYDVYETADGRWLSVGGLEPQFLKRTLEVLGIPPEPGPSSPQDPSGQRRLKQAIAEAVRKHSLKEWEQRFSEEDACVEPVLTLAEALEHPQLKTRRLVTQVAHADGSLQTQIASPLRLSVTPPQIRHPGTDVGAHTREVLEQLGWSSERVEKLLELQLPR